MAKPAFRQLVTAFLRDRMTEVAALHGPDSREYQALARQYVAMPEESLLTEENNLRHYDADLGAAGEAGRQPGVERLYRRTLVIEPTLACAAHCRYCIRANYARHNLSKDELEEIAKLCGDREHRDDLTEVLVTGGDPLLVPRRVGFFVQSLAQHAPNIRVVRVATRVPLHDPDLVTDDVLRLFELASGIRVELATQINHRVELFPQVREAFSRIMDRGVRVYAQNVLLRGVNDNLEALVDLYDAIRALGIEAHYLFHCVPLAGMGHLRTTLKQAIELGSALACSGEISGRAKPMLAVMTDIGKIVLYDGVILDRDHRRILLQSRYRLKDRRRWNPNWQLPRTAEVDHQGYLRVWYLDGEEADLTLASRPLPTRSRIDRMTPVPMRRRPTRVHSLPVIQHCP